MKVLHIIDSSGLYGAEIMLLNLMAAQQARGIQPVLFSMGHQREGRKGIEAEAAAREIALEIGRFGGSPWRATRRLLQAGRDHRADLLHSHGYKSNILLGFCPRAVRRLPVVATLHGWTSQRAFSRLHLYEMADQISLRTLEGVVRVTSDHTSPKWNGLLLRGLETTVIENGIPPLEMEGTPEGDIEAFARGHFTVGAAGRLSPEKGFDTLVEGFALLSRKTAGCRLVIMGEGRLRSWLEEEGRRLGVGDRVLFTGHRREAYRFFPLFSVFALPSRTEGLPITILEAMQAGVPIVASRVGEVPILLGHGTRGLLVDPGDSAGLAAALLSLKEDPQRGRRLAATARSAALCSYSAAEMARKYEELYRRVLEGKTFIDFAPGPLPIDGTPSNSS